MQKERFPERIFLVYRQWMNVKDTEIGDLEVYQIQKSGFSYRSAYPSSNEGVAKQ